MARDKQTARKSTGGKAPRPRKIIPTRAVRKVATPAHPVPTGVFPRDFVKKSRKNKVKENKTFPSLKLLNLP